MTIRNWDRRQQESSSPGFAQPEIRDIYSQNGTNATRAERQSKIWNVHGYNMSRTRLSKPRVVVTAFNQISNGSSDTVGAQPVLPNIPVPSTDKAVAKLLDKWRNSEFNLGLFIGEGKESAELIVERSLAIARSARELRRKNFGGALAALAHIPKSDRRGALKSMTSGHMAQAWLELQYGWKPLLSDIHAAADFFSKKAAPRGKILRSSEKNTGVITANLPFPASDVVTVKSERRVHLMVRVTNTASIPERLGLTDPFSVMWELTSFSFVADWFLPIGDSLLAAHAKQVMKTSQACTTSIEVQVAQLRIRSGMTYGFWKSLSDAVMQYNYVNMSRNVSFGVPSGWSITDQIPAMLTPTWSDNATRMLNAAALARTNLRALR